jgi:hypothetical protein
MSTLINTEDLCRRVGETLGNIIRASGMRLGFCLLVFGFDDAPDPELRHFLTYISNADRDSMLKTMKEFIAKHEAGEIAPPASQSVKAN